MQRWYVAHVESGQMRETRADNEAATLAEFSLRRLGYEAWCPQYLKLHYSAGRKVSLPAPLFPGYVLVRFDAGLGRWGDILNARGVLAILAGAGSDPMPLPDGFVERLMADVEANRGTVPMRHRDIPAVRYRRGEMLRVASGQLTDIIVEYIENDGERLKVLFDALGGRHTTTLAAGTKVEPAPEPRNRVAGFRKAS